MLIFRNNILPPTNKMHFSLGLLTTLLQMNIDCRLNIFLRTMASNAVHILGNTAVNPALSALQSLSNLTDSSQQPVGLGMGILTKASGNDTCSR